MSDKSSLRKAGKRFSIINAVATQAIPPNSAAGTAPKNPAKMPDSNSPSSFDELTKIELTEEILPRIASGEHS